MSRPGTLTDLLPPAILRLRRQLLGRERGYPSYASAREACGVGYNSDLLASVVARKTLQVKTQAFSHVEISDYRVFAALAFSGEGWDRPGGGGGDFVSLTLVVALERTTCQPVRSYPLASH